LHNVNNALAAVVAANQVGVNLKQACEALSFFVGIKRRMEPIYSERNLTVYDDFAHHPTAIKTTLEGLRAKVGDAQIVAVIEPRSATMKLGVHQGDLACSVASADRVLWYQNASIDWDLSAVAKDFGIAASVNSHIQSLVKETLAIIGANQRANQSTHIVIMSNGSFEGFHQRVLEQLR
jgi:UDP-N-acetylmuramate: L-alanyl-gamma-D-glutamyl-meso-diaminopimelate ligase